MANEIKKNLPKDVVSYLALKLPIKSLLRFKCISKSWNAFLQSWTFINLHLHRATSTNDEVVLFKRSFNDEHNQFTSIMSFLSSDGANVDLHPVSPDMEVPYLTTTTSCIFHRVLGPCNGLIVLTDEVTAVIINPTTRNYKLLKPSPFGSPLGFHRSIDGVAFGFDSIANEYKIVRLAEISGDPPFYCYTVVEWRVEVYELTIDSWREVTNVDQQLPSLTWYPCAELVYKGAAHWFGSSETVVILCFDMCTETFRNIRMPHSCHYNDRKCYGLVVLNESLTLICYPYPGCQIDHAIDFMEILVMKEYGVNESWIKTHTITPLAIESPLALWKDKFLLLQSITGHLISYDLNSDVIKELNLHAWPKSMRVKIYKESLTLIPKESRNNEQVQ